MVALSSIVSSNSLISSTFPNGLVALFVGATNGIGEITLKKFAKYSIQPRAYFIGRSQDAGNRIVEECKALNPSGEFIFRQADVSLIQRVDEVCKEIKAKEKSLNLLFLSAGVPSMDRSGMKSSKCSGLCKKAVLTPKYRNIRESPPAGCIKLLFPHPLNHQPPSSTTRFQFSSPCCHCRGRRTGGAH